MAKPKDFESEANFDSESNPKGGKRIIDFEPSATIATTKVCLVGMFSDRRQSMMVGMFNRKSILVIDGKIILFLWQDQIIPINDGIDGKTRTKVILGRPTAQLTQSQ
jgi:hypothetical protein